MQTVTINQKPFCTNETVTGFDAGKLHIELISTYENRAPMDELLYAIAAQKVSERLGQKRDNIVLTRGYGTI